MLGMAPQTKMKRTYIYLDDKLVERKKDSKGGYHYIIPDIAPYKSMIDGRMITSRSQHRSHLKAHGCVEVGNEDPTKFCLLYTSPSPRDRQKSRMPSSA